MVSSAVDMYETELLKTLARIRRDHGDTKEYMEWRGLFPKDWLI